MYKLFLFSLQYIKFKYIPHIDGRILDFVNIVLLVYNLDWRKRLVKSMTLICIHVEV